MNTNLIINRPAGFATTLNNLITGGLSLALVATAGMMTFAQFVTFA